MAFEGLKRVKEITLIELLAFDYVSKRSSELSEDFVYFDLLNSFRYKGDRN